MYPANICEALNANITMRSFFNVKKTSPLNSCKKVSWRKRGTGKHSKEHRSKQEYASVVDSKVSILY